MLFLNVSRAFKLRGVENPARHLLKLGISRPTISRLMNNDKSWVSYGHLEKICSVLNCTPNDLFEWKPDTNTVLPDAHSLNTLDKGAAAKSLQQMVKDIPSERLAEIENLLEGLKG